MADYTPTTFSVALLKRLNAPVTRPNVQAILGWVRAEGGNWNNDARFNPLNTTQPAAGAGNTGSQGNIKQYTSWDQGLSATVQTLRNGRYGNILSALKQGTDANAVGSAITNSPWGTGGLAAKVIANTKVGSVPTVASSAPSSLPKIPKAATAVAPANTAARGAAIRDFLFSKQDPLTLAANLKAAGPATVATVKAPAVVKAAPSPMAPSTGTATANGVVQFANSRIGHYAENLGSNRGTELDGLERRAGMTAQQWCSIFATTAVVHGGAGPQARTASVPQLTTWANEGSHGYQKGVLPVSAARAGDLIVRGGEHVGVVTGRQGANIIVTEGNANGAGGVVRRTYSPSQWTGVVRPK